MRTYLTFGKYNGLPLSDPSIPVEYLTWLAEPGGGRVYKNKHSSDAKWKAPNGLWIEVRLELDRRGYKLVGSRWEEK